MGVRAEERKEKYHRGEVLKSFEYLKKKNKQKGWETRKTDKTAPTPSLASD